MAEQQIVWMRCANRGYRLHAVRGGEGPALCGQLPWWSFPGWLPDPHPLEERFACKRCWLRTRRPEADGGAT